LRQESTGVRGRHQRESFHGWCLTSSRAVDLIDAVLSEDELQRMIEQAVQDARTDHAIDVERLQQENERLRAEVARWKACARGAVAAQRKLIDRFGDEDDEDDEE